jgi:hypothetical protein
MFSSNTSSAAGDANFVEDVFSTYLYTGNNATRTIVNGIDLLGKGGLVWTKQRASTNEPHILVDTARGSGRNLSSNTTGAEDVTGSLTAFTSSGYTISNQTVVNGIDAYTYVSWTFREQPKFFDVVTYTGTGSATTFAHNLGSVPGCIIVKCTSTGLTNWRVYHRSLTSAAYNLKLNLTSAEASEPSVWNSTAPTSTLFSVGADPGVNNLGDTYVAYLFAHDAGGFGLTGTDNVISCGSWTISGSVGLVNLGYEPQWVLAKRADDTGNWFIFDTMRGFTANQPNGNTWLAANTDSAENTGASFPGAINSTGWSSTAASGIVDGTYIYIAIRRGPMKVPTTGTSVFSPLARTGTGASATVTGVGFAPDLVVPKAKSNNSSIGWWDRLRGSLRKIISTGTDAETSVADTLTGFDVMDGFKVGPDTTYDINYTVDYINWNFKRAPGFFDVVCYTGDATGNRKITHNLAAVPELMIVKKRSSATFGSWRSYAAPLGATQAIDLNSNAAAITYSIWNDTTPTATQFTVQTNYANSSGDTFVAYLFATCSGVSKVFSYTGNGSSQTINCGFTGGARFVLIKRTDSTGDWYVWDTARGIVSGNDPHLSLNTTAAEVTTDDTIDTDSTGFVVNQVAATNVNVSSATYIGIAIS